MYIKNVKNKKVQNKKVKIKKIKIKSRWNDGNGETEKIMLVEGQLHRKSECMGEWIKAHSERLQLGPQSSGCLDDAFHA